VINQYTHASLKLLPALWICPTLC